MYRCSVFFQLDEWVLCRLYNKKNNWEKVKVEEQDMAVAAPPHHHTQNGEVMDSMTGDALSDSFQTHDSSEMDNASGLQQQHYGYRDMAQGPARDGIVKVKEDNDWFTGLNMDDLQACYMSQLGQMVSPPAAPGLDSSSSYLQSLSSPQMMWQTVLPPF